MSIVLKQEEMDIEENDVNDADLIGVATHSEEETATPRNLPEELWEKGSVTRLLRLYLKHLDEFQDPGVRKKNLWKGIGTALGKDPEACNRKFRNLKHHYVTLLRKRNQFGLNNTWPFFDLFEEINRNNDFKVIEKFKFSSYPRAQAWGPRFVVVRGAPAMNAYTVGATGGGNTSSFTGVRRRRRKRNHQDKDNLKDEVQSERRKNIESVELKLNHLIKIMEESNDIQKERNRLFQDYLSRISQ